MYSNRLQILWNNILLLKYNIMSSAGIQEQ